MQTAVSLLQRLHQHRAWVNENLLASAVMLNDQQLRHPFAIGQGSVWKSFLHMFAAEWIWLEAPHGNDNPLFPGDVGGKTPGNQLGTGGIQTFAELQEKWQALQIDWKHDLENLKPETLEDPIYKISSSAGNAQRFVCHRYDALLHVCTHAQYTAAQVVNMLRHLGVEKLPKTMMITLAREEDLLETQTL